MSARRDIRRFRPDPVDDAIVGRILEAAHDAPSAHAALNANSMAAWLAVGAPIAWGVWVTLQKAVVLFK